MTRIIQLSSSKTMRPIIRIFKEILKALHIQIHYFLILLKCSTIIVYHLDFHSRLYLIWIINKHLWWIKVGISWLDVQTVEHTWIVITKYKRISIVVLSAIMSILWIRTTRLNNNKINSSNLQFFNVIVLKSTINIIKSLSKIASIRYFYIFNRHYSWISQLQDALLCYSCHQISIFKTIDGRSASVFLYLWLISAIIRF